MAEEVQEIKFNLNAAAAIEGVHILAEQFGELGKVMTLLAANPIVGTFEALVLIDSPEPTPVIQDTIYNPTVIKRKKPTNPES
ncbi:MAG: hypothetical protein WCJ61_13190 [Paludibacter sp.]